jgi:hypothetical protein
MALSMEEQRILAEIEQELARSEPVLAARLSAFGRVGRGAHARPSQRGKRGRVLHSPWVLVVASLVALVLLTVVPVTVYALVSLRVGSRGQPTGHPAISAQHHLAPAHPVMAPAK